jgi:hypothetical protein
LLTEGSRKAIIQAKSKEEIRFFQQQLTKTYHRNYFFVLGEFCNFVVEHNPT